MKAFFLLLTTLAVAAGAVVAFHGRMTVGGGGGYVIVGQDQWSLETSLYFAVLVLIVVFAILYWTIRTLSAALSLPKTLKQRGAEIRGRRSREALINGLIETAEGNWENAEKQLIRHASDSGAPLINYLTAARAAHSRGAIEQRDEYFKLAKESMPEAELAIGLTKAELQLSNQQFEDALENLIQLNRIDPGHGAVLRMMHQAYTKAEDWEGLIRLLPKLHANKVLMEAEIKLLEVETYTALLKRKAETRSASAMRDAWLDVPQHIRDLPGIQQLYFAAMIDAGAGVEIEPKLRETLRKEWSEVLLVLYGCIKAKFPEQHLGMVEGWLATRPKDPVLLRVLGKLSIRANRLEKAKAYLKSSLEIEASAEAFQMMGDILLSQNKPAEACEYFRKGLTFASSEYVAMIEQKPEGESDASILAASEVA